MDIDSPYTSHQPPHLKEFNMRRKQLRDRCVFQHEIHQKTSNPNYSSATTQRSQSVFELKLTVSLLLNVDHKKLECTVSVIAVSSVAAVKNYVPLVNGQKFSVPKLKEP
jgi:hypothetical protein